MAEKFMLQQSNIHEEITRILNLYSPTKVILSSVVNHEKSIENLIAKQATLYVLNSNDFRLPFLNAYGSPETLGHDRLALVAALSKFYPGEDSLVISVGSCVTYNFLAKNNAFRGGAISPGLEMRLRSLNEFTDKLPLISREGHVSLLGYDTETSLRSGVVMGIASEIDGMIERYESQYGRINAVLTGGDGAFFESRLKSKIFADSNFLFKGLYAILEFQK